MEHAKQVELSKEILRHIRAKTTAMADDLTLNPVTTYTDPAVLRREREVLFRQYPQLVGFSCQFPKAGGYLTNDHAGVPIVVLRDEAGGIASEAMQAGFASGAQEHVILGRNEPALAYFQNAVKAALG